MLARGKAVHITVVPQSDGEEHCTPERPSHALWPRHLRDRLAALLAGDASYTLCPVQMQRLEPFIALLLIRQRPTHMAGSGQHWALGAAVTSLPSGVLAMVCEAMMKLESKLDVRPSRLLRLCAGCCGWTAHETSSLWATGHTSHSQRAAD